MKLLSQKNDVEPRLIEAVQREIARAPDILALRKRRATLEQNDDYVRSTIRVLKARLKWYPRNALLCLETARHYCILGQYNSAERFLRIAHAIAPQDRTILRAMVQFYDVVGDLTCSLSPLWKAEGLKYDPLIQSAEMAATQIARRASKIAGLVKQRMKGLTTVEKKRSEAALAVATLEKASGVSERAVFKFVAAGLADPTENAIAQAIWVSEHSKGRVIRRYPELHVKQDAFEARAYLFFEKREYGRSLEEAFLWSLDQPFQAHPLAFICSCAAVYTEVPEVSLTAADRIMTRHSTDFNAVNAALLTFAACGMGGRAEAAVSAMKKIAETDVEKAFLSAGFGLVAYLSKDVPKAQEYYFSAMRMSRKAKRPDLAFTAGVFFMVGETRNSNPPREELQKAIALLDRVINRVPVEARPDLDRLWARGKQIIAEAHENRLLGQHEGSNGSVNRVSAASVLIDEATELFS